MHPPHRLGVQVLMDVYGKLVKADEFIGVSKGEVYFRTLRGCVKGRPGGGRAH